MDCPEEIENWPHNSSAWRFSYYYPLSKAMPGPVAFIYWPLLLPWHSHSTRKDLWSCNHTFTTAFSGIELDSVSFEARLPGEKLEKCVATISDFLTRKMLKLLKRKFSPWRGLLNFACSVVEPARAFLRRLIYLTFGILFPYRFIRLSKEVKLDLQS